MTPNTHTDPSLNTSDHKPKRFDERGIALQTVIILVVMLAIAGGIAAVLLGRAREAEDSLEAAQIGVSLWTAKSAGSCGRLGGTWDADGGPNAAQLLELQVAFNDSSLVAGDFADGFCYT